MRGSIIVLFLLFTLGFTQETGARYLIITHNNYYNVLIPLAQWKTRKGVKAKIVKLSEIGSDSTQIRNYIINAYNNWTIKPQYLLLVGNKNQIPFPLFYYQSEQYHSDNYYTNIQGDYKNEIIPGRFWVYDTNQVKTIVAKVLGYEKNPYLDDPLWLKKGVTIVNESGVDYATRQLYWADARYVHNFMKNAGFAQIDSFSYSRGHTRTHVINAINNGRSYVLYRGLGGGDWTYPFDEISPANLNNGFKLPIVVSATCGTVEGIGYEWLNAGTPQQPKGTVGFMGTTTFLIEAAELRSFLAKGSFQSIFCDSFTTLGKACEKGRQTVYDQGIWGSPMEYNSWTCLGDPEMTVWTTTPKQIVVSHDSILRVGICLIQVNVQCSSTPVESALVCVMAKQDSTVYKYGRTNNLGNINLMDTLHILADSVLITVTGRNLKPYFSSIPVYPGTGVHLLLESFSISDNHGGNGDSIANPGEDIEIPLWVMNWGDSTAYNASGVMHNAGSELFCTLHDTIKYFGNVPSLDSVFTGYNGYNVLIEPNCPDNQKIELQLILSDMHDSSWTSDLDFTVHAPIIIFNDYYFTGGVKYTAPGDTEQLCVELKNIGSYKTENMIGKIFSNDHLVMVLDSTASFGTIAPGSSTQLQSNPFIITTSPETPTGHSANIKMVISSEVYIDTLDFTIYIGQKDYLIWDPDLNHSSGPAIKIKLDSLNFHGDYSIQFPYGLLSLYKSLFVCAGVYPNNYIIKDTSRSGQEIGQYLTSFNGEVYLEGGDVWYTDYYYYHGYNLSPLFSIQRITGTIGALSNVIGVNGTFTQAMIFNYSDASNSLDNIGPLGTGVLIFKNSANGLGCGVAANHKTVGVSFEFGALTDNTPSTTRITLLDSIMHNFGIISGIVENQSLQNPAMPDLVIYPNPCRYKLNIRLQTETLPMHKTNDEHQATSLKIYDCMGKLVKNFSLPIACSLLPTVISWDGTDDFGQKVAEGVYFLFLSAPNYGKSKKLILIR